MTKKDKARIEELEDQVKWLQLQIDKLQEKYSPVGTSSSNPTISGNITHLSYCFCPECSPRMYA